MLRHIFLFSPVTSMSAEFLIRQLLDLDRESKDEITIFINSPGGLVTELFAIIDTMNLIRSPIRTVVMGMAASAAAVIAAAADTRLITENSQYMLHEVIGFTMGSASEMDEKMKLIVKMQDRLLKILSKSTGKSVEKLKALTKKTDKYFTAQEAVRFGLADKVIKSNEAQLLKLSEGINVEGYQISYKEKGQSEVQLLKEGKFSHPVYGDILISEKDLDKMAHNFIDKIRGIDISIDYTHDNDDGENPAACWIKNLEVKDTEEGKGLFAQVEFTPKGLKLVQEKEYKYVSADFRIDYMTETGKHVPYVLCGGTLTNRPFIKEMNPIKLSEYNPTKEETSKMNKEALMNALKELGIDVVVIQNQLETSDAKIVELQNRIQQLSALPAEKEAEITNLKEQISKLNKDVILTMKNKVFDELVSQGKVLPAQKESVFETFATAEDLTKYYKDSPAVVKMKPSGHKDEVDAEELTKAEQAVVDSGDYTKEEILNTRSSAKKVKK